jgi:hypothetical protein
MSDTYKLQYNGMTLAYPGWNGYVGYEPQLSQQIRLIGSTTTPVTFNFSDGQSYTVTGTQDIAITKGTTVTITAHSPLGKTFSLQGLDKFNISNITWNHKTYTGSFVTANATLDSIVNNDIPSLGLYNERNKQFSACVTWPISTNQEACCDYQPGLFVSAISSNMHSNNIASGEFTTEISDITSASVGRCNRGGWGSKGWTQYDGGIDNVYNLTNVFGWDKVTTWSAWLTMTNLAGYQDTMYYTAWGNTQAGGESRKYALGTFPRYSTKTFTFTGNGLNGRGPIYVVENQKGTSYASNVTAYRPCNHSGYYNMTGILR